MDILKKILKFITNAFLVLVFIVLILVIFAKVKTLASKDNYFSIFGYSVFEVTTGSMSPTINQNDIVIVKKGSTYEKNDIITYKSNNDFITHRIIEVTGDSYLTKGDANNSSDGQINKNLIIGKVIKIYSNLGIWKKIISDPKIIALIFVTLILFDFAFSYKGNDDKKNKSKKTLKEKTKEKLEDAKNEVIKEEQENKEIVKEINNKEITLSKEEAEKAKKNIAAVEEDYTVRLDLEEIRKSIDKKVNKEKHGKNKEDKK